ncbi:PREDICTED: acyl-coenzyme A synthetase ACSM4, mitochondrial [Bison bison bison]|uniref:medium-chain acyl-CoA ligase n=1 Tax=Bison bison bison TaxID=43346 RepID=A0A6P3H9E1_BISBB|nr:PREDICTED: acyl-coenzyme A synthetase ACSM4, mitochondrial [Bison bison bison]
MKIFFRYQTFRFIWLTKPIGRRFHKSHQLGAPLTLADFEAINRCERSLPKNFNFAGDVLDQWSQKEKTGERPANPALWWVNGKGDEVKWSFGELGSLSRKAANVLTKPCGLERGDRVAVILPRIPEWWLINVACMRTGLVFMPGTTQLTAKDILYRLHASKAKCIVASEEVIPAVESIVSECPDLKTKLLVSPHSQDGWLSFPELFQTASAEHSCVETGSQEPMAIYFTSGTTGSPKMAQHSQSSLGIGYTLCGRYWLDLKSTDIIWNMSDTGWIKAAIGSVFSSWLQGACVFVHRMAQFDTNTFLDTLTTYPITTLCSAPTVYRMLVQKDLKRYKFKKLRHCLTGGEPLNPEVLEQWKVQTGLELYEGYGQTEVGIICANQKGQEIKPGSMGKGVLPYDVQIIDENGNILPPGKEGEIALRLTSTRPFCFFSEYVDNPEKTAATIRGNFYVTGDRGVMDSDGYFWFVGRADDVIISSGYRIGPFEVESALIEHPAVIESAVVSSPDPVRGEVVKAFVVLSAPFKSSNPEKLTLELQDHVKKSTAPYKYPRKVEFVKELPKTITGKIKRNVLRDHEWGRT